MNRQLGILCLVDAGRLDLLQARHIGIDSKEHSLGLDFWGITSIFE